MASERSILSLEDYVNQLSDRDRSLFERIFRVFTTEGRTEPPASMVPWIEARFGDVERVRRQKIIKVVNLVTMEGALFNSLRASRPMEARSSEEVESTIKAQEGDPFCRPLELTPSDIFGRIRGRHSITASNVAKYDGFHGLVIFDHHDPLSFGREEVKDYIDTAVAWARKAHQTDPEARYFFLMWNCLWKSGASIIHGHLQMTLTRGMHYAKVEALRRAALNYREKFGSDYFDDLYRVHEALGLGWEKDGVRYIAYLTPIKEKETLLIAPGLSDSIKEAVHTVLRAFIDRMGVKSFNVAFYMPPLAPTPEDWGGFPCLVRLVDRGDPSNRTADFGAMELYAASVISDDPFQVAEILRESM